ncbi:MAG: type II secretion system protein GspM [Thiohalomonadaceae bacterium]
MIPLRYHPHLSVASTLLVLLLLLLLILIPLWTAKANKSAQISQMTPRIARLAGIEQTQVQIQQAAAAVRSELTQLSYPANQQTAQVGTAMQQTIRRIMSSAGLNIVNSQVMAPRIHPQFEEISVTITAQGTMDSLQNALIALQHETPSLFAGTILIQPTGRAARGQQKSSQLINAQISFSTAHLVP